MRTEWALEVEGRKERAEKVKELEGSKSGSECRAKKRKMEGVERFDEEMAGKAGKEEEGVRQEEGSATALELRKDRERLERQQRLGGSGMTRLASVALSLAMYLRWGCGRKELVASPRPGRRFAESST